LLNKQETAKVIAIIQATYPSFYEKADTASQKATLDIWRSIFADHDYAEVSSALMAFIATDTKGYPPVPGQLNAKIRTLRDDAVPEQEIWIIIRRAISNGRYGYTKEFAKLPSVVQKIVGDPSALREWADLDDEKLNTIIRAQIVKSYQAHLEREKELDMLPTTISARIGKRSVIGYVS